MRRLIFILLLVTATGNAQFYVDLGIDPNKVFGIMDNPRTEEDHMGFDFDIEVGKLVDPLGVFVFYGRFQAAEYQNFGAGLCYYLLRRRFYDIAVGSAASVILKKQASTQSREGRQWNSFLSWDARLTGVVWIFPEVGLSAKLQYQRRPDIEIAGIIEGKVGIRFMLN